MWVKKIRNSYPLLIEKWEGESPPNILVTRNPNKVRVKGLIA
jgi:hypothetical protein